MDWLRRLWESAGPPADTPSKEEDRGESVERVTPGVAALLERVSRDGSHAVLDLGPGGASLNVYSRFARRVRFADLLADGMPGGGLDAAFSALPPQPSLPYDLVFAWNLLDRLRAEDRPRLMRHLAEITAPDARLHVVAAASDTSRIRPLRFVLLDVDRLRLEPLGPARTAPSRLLPAELEALLAPFEVVRVFSSEIGLMEYVAVRDGA